MPSEFRRASSSPRSLDDLAPEERERVLAAMRNYLNLCSEELFLNKKGWVDNEAWDLW